MREALAKERIEILWEQAQEVALEKPKLARSWVITAKHIARKARIKLPSRISRKICRNCGTIFLHERDFRVRIRNNRATHVTVTCKHCGTIRRFLVKRQA